MPCIKCGRKLEEGQAFCPQCLAEMDQYPIKPGTPVQLPQHSQISPAKPRQKKREIKPEEQIQQLRSANTWLKLMVAALLAGFVLLAVFLILLLEKGRIDLPDFRRWLPLVGRWW